MITNVFSEDNIYEKVTLYTVSHISAEIDFSTSHAKVHTINMCTYHISIGEFIWLIGFTNIFYICNPSETHISCASDKIKPVLAHTPMLSNVSLLIALTLKLNRFFCVKWYTKPCIWQLPGLNSLLVAHVSFWNIMDVIDCLQKNYVRYDFCMYMLSCILRSSYSTVSSKRKFLLVSPFSYLKCNIL